LSDVQYFIPCTVSICVGFQREKLLGHSIYFFRTETAPVYLSGCKGSPYINIVLRIMPDLHVFDKEDGISESRAVADMIFWFTA